MKHQEIHSGNRCVCEVAGKQLWTEPQVNCVPSKRRMKEESLGEEQQYINSAGKEKDVPEDSGHKWEPGERGGWEGIIIMMTSMSGCWVMSFICITLFNQ